MRFLSSSAELEKIGVILLDQSPPGPGHRVEAGTVRELKVSIVADKDRIQVLADTFGRATSSVANRRGRSRHRTRPEAST